MTDNYAWLPWVGVACIVGGTAYVLHVMRRISRGREWLWEGLDDAFEMGGLAILTGWAAILMPKIGDCLTALLEGRSTSFFWLAAAACIVPPAAVLYVGYRIWLRPLRAAIDFDGLTEGAER